MGSDRLTCREVLGAATVDAMARARSFLEERSTDELLALVGQTVDSLALADPPADKRAFPASFREGKPCDGDLLAGLGMFYVTQSGTVMLDCTSGHYQMTWGYNHPELCAAAEEAMRLGVVWDNHANTPSMPVKMLADALVAAAGDAGLDRVSLAVCTGSAACGAALKIMLRRYAADPERQALGPPVVIALAGNYHGTGIACQALRGMWPGFTAGMQPLEVEPNDADALRAAFAEHGRRVAGFWAEPVMMNREALLVEPAYLHLARELCSRHGALMAIDEIQTGFWHPDLFLFRRLGLAPDFVIIGKGMTAGFHPLAGLLLRHELDVLEQYGALNTNGQASLAAFIALCNLRLIEREGGRIAELARRHHEGLCALAAEFPDLIEAVHGDGFLTGLRMRGREDALGLHKAAVARGLWLRAHAYHPGHRAVLLKYALVADAAAVAFVLAALRELLAAKPWRA